MKFMWKITTGAVAPALQSIVLSHMPTFQLWLKKTNIDYERLLSKTVRPTVAARTRRSPIQEPRGSSRDTIVLLLRHTDALSQATQVHIRRMFRSA